MNLFPRENALGKTYRKVSEKSRKFQPSFDFRRTGDFKETRSGFFRPDSESPGLSGATAGAALAELTGLEPA
jgi:hypothetical protein